VEPAELEMLRAIFAAPNRDEPRLAYAAWLEAQGQPERAEFIRIQCCGGDRRREEELLAAHGAAWRAAFLPAGLENPPLAFQRGFPCVRPSLQYYRYQDGEGLSACTLALAGSPYLLGCRRLSLGYSTWLSDQAARALAESPFACHLEELELHEVVVAPAELEALAALPAMSHLILIGGCSVDAGGQECVFPSLSLEGLRRLAGSSRVNLRKITLANQDLDQAAIQPLLESPNLANLTIVVLDYGNRQQGEWLR
jgi:uncharacterized protein (TIGR02996 family)